MSPEFPQNPLDQDKARSSVKSRKVMVLGAGDKVFRLHKDRVVVGSVVSADIKLQGEGVAPLHAVIEIADDGATVFDLASDTGVFVNGAKAITQSIRSGDELTIGHHKLKFTLEDLASRAFNRDEMWESEGRRLFFDPKENVAALLLEDERLVEEIFDYGPSSQQALQVVMAWFGTVLDIEHFVKEKAVLVGPDRAKDDFGIPPMLGAVHFPIVNRDGQSFFLNVDPNMKGVIHKRGKLSTLEELRESMMVGGNANQIPIEKDDFAKVSIGDITFYFSFTAAPPRLKRRRLFEKDPFFTRIFLASIFMSVLAMLALSQIQVDKTLEAEQIPERIATILYQPEKFQRPPVPIEKPKPEVEKVTDAKPPEPEKPKPKPPEPKPQETVKVEIKPTPEKTVRPVPKEMVITKQQAPNKSTATQAKQAGSKVSQSEAKEGQGARAKGTEGSRGTKTAAANKQQQNQAYRPSPQGGPGRGAGDSQVQDEGNLDILKGASGRIQDLLGNSAAKLGAGGEKLKGFGGFNTKGEGGLALSGKGSGGGGDAASLGGLSDKGTGGGRVGTGKGAAGNGTGIIGGQTRVALRTGGDEETVVSGAIDSGAIDAAIREHLDEFRLCYEKEINAETGKIGGTVIPNFVIGSSGHVTNAGISSSSLKNANVERCVIKVIRSIKFPIPKGAGVVEVKYPFRFNAVGG